MRLLDFSPSPPATCFAIGRTYQEGYELVEACDAITPLLRALAQRHELLRGVGFRVEG
jgi:hypothetical protein